MTNEDDIQFEISLAGNVADGSETAFRTYYERYAEPLYLFIYHLADRNKEDAEEIWQDTLLASLQAINRFRGESRLFTWLCAIARRKASDRIRREVRQKSSSLAVFVEHPDVDQLPEKIWEERRLRARIVETMECLPGEYRECLLARYATELSVSEISVRMHKSYKATESLLARARQAFKNAFDQEGGA